MITELPNSRFVLKENGNWGVIKVPANRIADITLPQQTEHKPFHTSRTNEQLEKFLGQLTKTKYVHVLSRYITDAIDYLEL